MAPDAVRLTRHDAGVPVGVVDVGSNTVRLLVADEGRQVLTVREAVGLGADVENHGSISPVKLEETATVVAALVHTAREAGTTHLDVLITSPGRQAANGDELLDTVERAAGAPTRILSAAEEARLAFVGALAGTPGLVRRRVAVVDVGGGSSQVTIGTRHGGPTWIRSLDIGSLRLTRRLLAGDPPGADAVAEAQAELARLLEGFDPPEPQAALAVGGSARTLRRIAGARLGRDELAEVLSLLATTTADDLIRRFDLPQHRARTLTAGAVILAALQERLRTPLRVARTGLREGALVELAERRAAA